MYLKGQDLLKEIQGLPELPEPATRLPTPELDAPGTSDSDDSDSDVLHSSPTLRSLATETKLLYRDVIKFSSTPRVVDLSALHAKRMDTHAKGGKVWMPKKKTPAHQVWERKMEAERLSRRVRGLIDRSSAYI
jgi:dynactin 1